MLLAMFTLKPEQSKASHVAGADLTYSPTGNPNEFLVRLKVYRDCNPSSSTLLTTADICYSSLSNNFSQSVTANEVSITAVPSSICVNASPGNCSQAGGPGDTEEHIYETTITLPFQSADWIFAWELCCRNAAITTLVDPDLQGLYVDARLDNIIAPTNSSPVFTSLAFSRFCVGNAFNYEQGATDADGDSLVFSLTGAEDATGGCPYSPFFLEYKSPFDSLNPLSSSVPITIDHNTGTIYFVTSQVEVAIICVKVEEFRNGVKIGQVKRDIQVKVVSNCNPVIPAWPSGIIGGGTSTGGYQLETCNEYSIILPLNSTYPIQCASAIPSDFRTYSPFNIPNPVVAVAPINCTNGLTDSLLITFLHPLSAGVTKLWSKKGFDGNTFLGECGFELADSQDTVYIYVDTTVVTQLVPQIDSVGCIFNNFSPYLSDSVYCHTVNVDGSDFILYDATGAAFPIASAYPYCDPNGIKTNQLLINMAGNVSGVSPYYLVVSNALLDGNTLADDCGRYVLAGDTIAILYSNNKIYVNLGADQNVCRGASNPVINAGISGLTYQWYNSSGIIPGATSESLTVIASGTYIVQVTNGPNCGGSDTIVVTIVDNPTDNLPADMTQCVNDPIPTFNAGNAGATYQWYQNGIALPGETNQTYTPATGVVGANTYSVLVINAGICAAEFDVQFNTFSAFPVNVLTDASACNGSTYPQLDAGAQAATIGLQWYRNGNSLPGQTGQFFTPSTAGTYSVTVGTGACASNSSMVFTVVDLPVVSLSNASVCNGDPIPTLDPGATSGATYQWFQDGNMLPGETNQTYTPTVAGVYSVDVTVQPGCTSTASMTLNIGSGLLFSVSDANVCTDQSATLAVTISADTYHWSTGATTSSINVAPGVGGTYIVTVTSGSCSSSDTAKVIVSSYPAAPVVTCSLSETGPKFLYTWTAVSGVTGYEVSEDNGATWAAANVPNGPESHSTNNAVSGFLVRGIGSGICVQGYSSEPTACQVTPYNIITPNADGLNEYFVIENIEQYANNTVQIFNRWGKEVYTGDGYNNGSVKFTGSDLPEGTYYYIINLNQEGKGPLTGTVSIYK